MIVISHHKELGHCIYQYTHTKPGLALFTCTYVHVLLATWSEFSHGHYHPRSTLSIITKCLEDELKLSNHW